MKNMKKTVLTATAFVCLATTLSFAGTQSNSKTPSGETNDSKSLTAQADTQNIDNQNAPGNAGRKDKKKNNRTPKNAKPAPTKEEQEFDKMLLGIYG
jgi:hypothetical protein